MASRKWLLLALRFTACLACRAFDVGVLASPQAQKVSVSAKEGVRLTSGLDTAASNTIVLMISRTKPQASSCRIGPPPPLEAPWSPHTMLCTCLVPLWAPVRGALLCVLF